MDIVKEVIHVNEDGTEATHLPTGRAIACQRYADPEKMLRDEEPVRGNTRRTAAYENLDRWTQKAIDRALGRAILSRQVKRLSENPEEKSGRPTSH